MTSKAPIPAAGPTVERLRVRKRLSGLRLTNVVAPALGRDTPKKKDALRKKLRAIETRHTTWLEPELAAALAAALDVEESELGEDPSWMWADPGTGAFKALGGRWVRFSRPEDAYNARDDLAEMQETPFRGLVLTSASAHAIRETLEEAYGGGLSQRKRDLVVVTDPHPSQILALVAVDRLLRAPEPLGASYKNAFARECEFPFGRSTFEGMSDFCELMSWRAAGVPLEERARLSQDADRVLWATQQVLEHIASRHRYVDETRRIKQGDETRSEDDS